MFITRYKKIFNMLLRGLTLVSKFSLVFFLARFLEPAELGIYGLLSATVSYSLYFLGIDFYTYTTRELLASDRSLWGGMLKSQCVLFFIIYIIVLPTLGVFFYYDLLPMRVFGWFFSILILEHINQELMRIFVAVSEPFYASVLLFFRSGLWSLLVTVLMFLEPNMRSIDFVFFAWLSGSVFALFLGAYKIKSLKLSGWASSVDWSWLIRGIKISTSLLFATLAIRGVFTVDRYWFQELAGTEILGAYVLFMGICMALMSFLDAGVFVFLYPGLISAFQQGDVKKFRFSIRVMFFQTLCLSAPFALVSLLAIDPILGWLDRPIYIAHRELFLWLLLATILFALSMVPHYGLYAQGYDRSIIRSHVASLVVFVLATWGFSQHWNELAVPLGLCVSFFVMVCWKYFAFYRLTPAAYRIFQF